MSENQQVFYSAIITSAIIESIANDIGGNKSIDITNIIQYYEFTESLFSPTIYGKIIIADGIGLLNSESFTITGEEFLTIGITTGEDLFFEYKFVISNIDSEIKSGSADASLITLSLISVDGFSNLFTFKSKGYRDISITDMVKTILLTELNTQVAIENDNFIQTTGVRSFAFTKIRPLEKIAMLSQQAHEQTDYLSSTYVFYEDRKGYNFKSIEKIIESSKANTSPLTYEYSQISPIFFITEPNKRLIRQLLPTSRMNSYSRLVSGFYNTNVTRFDFVHNRVTQENFNAYEDARKFAHMIGEQNNNNAYTLNVSEAFAQRVAAASDYSCLLPWNSDINDSTYKSIVFSGPFLQLLNENTLNIVIDGSLAFDLGDPLIIQVADNRASNDPEKTLDPRYSGKYFVTAINHSIGTEGGGDTTYTCSVTLTRDLMPISQEIYNQQTAGEFDIPNLAEGGYV